MNLDAAFRQLVREEVRAALADLPERRGGLVPIKSKPLGVPYRQILSAERAGELRVFRRGHTSCVDVAELEQWLRRAPVERAEAEPEPDEVAQLIELANRRRRRSG